MPQQITILKIRRSGKGNINEELQWLAESLGLFNLRDKDSSCFRVFITLVKTSRNNTPLSSDEIAHKLNLTRGTAVHHLHKLMDAGVVIKEKDGYLLREGSMEQLVDKLEKDFNSILSDMKKIAREIDDNLG
jgi:predicted transcriptional regulator